MKIDPETEISKIIDVDAFCRNSNRKSLQKEGGDVIIYEH